MQTRTWERDIFAVGLPAQEAGCSLDEASPLLSNRTGPKATQKDRRAAALWRSALWSRICLGSKMAAVL